MRAFTETVPLFAPVVVLSVILATLTARRTAAWLGTPPGVAWLLLVGSGLILAATLTPLRDAIEHGLASSGTCDLRRIGPAPLSTYLRPNETSANVVLFMPLGLALGMLPGSLRTKAIIAGALLLPLAIELTQLAVPVWGRGCQSADMFDNAMGLALGFLGGHLVRAFVSDRRGSWPPAG